MKFLFKNFLLLFACSFLLIINVNAASNPYGKYQDLYGIKTVRCTWYAWEQAYDNAGVALPGWGNAQEWYNSAVVAGYSVGKEAKANSIAVWSSSDGYGHVAYVVSVDDDGKYMTINEGGIPIEENEGILVGSRSSTSSSSLIGFIYLDEKPKNTGSTSIYNSSSNNDTNKKKSSNNNLKNLNVDVEGFTFDSEIKEYDLIVSYDVNIVTIKATAEDNTAIITGTGEKALSVGNNTFKIIITAADGTENEYVINITRSENENASEIKPIKKVTKVEDNTNLFIVSGIGALLFLVGILLLIKIKKVKSIKLIVFDFVGVLVTEKDISMNDDEINIEKLFGKNKSDEEYIEEARKYIKSKEKIIKCTKRLINNLYEVKDFEIFSKLKEKFKNVKIVIATNHVSWIREYIENKFDGYDDIVISAEIGKVKPDKEFFEYIIDKYGVKSSEILFLDDNKSNIIGAKKMGINTLKVNKNTNILSKIVKLIK